MVRLASGDTYMLLGYSSVKSTLQQTELQYCMQAASVSCCTHHNWISLRQKKNRMRYVTVMKALMSVFK